MMIDVTSTVGFPTKFDPQTMELFTGDTYRFKRQVRSVGDQHAVLRSPDAADPNTPAYFVYYPIQFPTAVQAILDTYELTYSFVALPSLKIGDEYVKTTGHYHPAIPGTSLPFPEVYTQLYGTLQLLLQKQGSETNGEVTDCHLVNMTPGFSITVPPGYAHVLINTSSEPALMAGLYGRDFSPFYEPILEKKGLAHYLIEENNEVKVVPNPLYLDRPPLNVLVDTGNTPFEYDDPGVMLWTSFMNQPEKYAFLTDSLAVMEKF